MAKQAKETDVALVRALAALLRDNGLTELEVERGHEAEGRLTVRLSRASLTAPVIAAAPVAPAAPVALAGAVPVEPPAADDPVLRHPKAILSPHAAFYSLDSDEELRRRSVTNVISFLETGRPENLVVEGTR